MTNVNHDTGRYDTDDSKQELTDTLMAHFRTNGFQKSRINDIASMMHISKATFYKHFDSKESILTLMVDQITKYIDSEIEIPVTASYTERFQRIFLKSLTVATYEFEPFMTDLRVAYPALVGKIDQANKIRRHKIIYVFEKGSMSGEFTQQNAELFELETEFTIRRLIDSHFLMQNNLNAKSIEDYYLMKKQQLVANPSNYSDDWILKNIQTIINSVL